MTISEMFGHSPCYGKHKINFLCGEVIEVLRTLPDESVDCIATSPPYFRLRDYGHDDQIGMEQTPGEFVDKLVGVFREARRVLKSTGTLWINIGDSYAGSGKSGSTAEGRKHHRQFAKVESEARQVGPTRIGNIYPDGYQPMAPGFQPTGKLKGKDMIGAPWMLAFSLRDDGWYLRSDIIWAKKQYTPESVKDRPTRSHEHIFMLSKDRQYYYDIDAIRRYSGANARDVWSIGLEHSSEKHYAQFPTEIPRRIIKVSTPQSANAVVLDPFAGSCTTGLVAAELGRSAIMIDIKDDYLKMGQERLKNAGYEKILAPIVYINEQIV